MDHMYPGLRYKPKSFVMSFGIAPASVWVMWSALNLNPDNWVLWSKLPTL